MFGNRTRIANAFGPFNYRRNTIKNNTKIVMKLHKSLGTVRSGVSWGAAMGRAEHFGLFCGIEFDVRSYRLDRTRNVRKLYFQ